jgi:hypothetical protein
MSYRPPIRAYRLKIVHRLPNIAIKYNLIQVLPIDPLKPALRVSKKDKKLSRRNKT